MFASPVQAVKQGSACSYTHVQARKAQKDIIVTWTHQNATETVKYQKALGKIAQNALPSYIRIV